MNSFLSQQNREGRPQTKGATFVKQALLILLVVFGALLSPRPSHSVEQPAVAIIYPDVPSPYSAVFQAIIEGITAQNKQNYRFFSLGKSYDQEQLRTRLKEDQIDGIIALGKRGFLATKQLKLNLPTVVGALPLIPNGISGISLSTDPEILFSRLKQLIPDIRQVFVVYSPHTSGWLIPLAKKAAADNNLTLHAYPAKTLREAMLHYRRFLNDISGTQNAIWLPLDSISANEDVVLPMLLQEAWDKELILCASKPSLVQRGALLSLYADNYGLGENLAQKLRHQMLTGESTGVVPLKTLHLAINLRTAAHLGLNFSSTQQQTFNLMFPSR